MASLFPSYKSLATKKMKFDSTDECVVARQQRQKKAAIPQSRGRVKCITTLVLEDRPKFIPKGKKQKEHLMTVG